MSPVVVIALVAAAHILAAASFVAPLIGRKLKGELPADIVQIR